MPADEKRDALIAPETFAALGAWAAQHVADGLRRIPASDAFFTRFSGMEDRSDGAVASRYAEILYRAYLESVVARDPGVLDAFVSLPSNIRVDAWMVDAPPVSGPLEVFGVLDVLKEECRQTDASDMGEAGMLVTIMREEALSEARRIPTGCLDYREAWAPTEWDSEEDSGIAVPGF